MDKRAACRREDPASSRRRRRSQTVVVSCRTRSSSNATRPRDVLWRHSNPRRRRCGALSAKTPRSRRLARRARRPRSRAAGAASAAPLAHCAETALEVAELGMREEVVAAAMTTLSFDARYSTFAPEEAERLLASTSRGLYAARAFDVSDVSRASVRPISDDERARLRAMLLAATDARAVTIELASRLVRVRRDDASTELFAETAARTCRFRPRLGVWSRRARLEDARRRKDATGGARAAERGAGR